jgi:hypothetical protein
VLDRRTILWSLLPWVTGCQQLGLFPSDSEEISDGAPYTLSILAQENCSLPENLDPKTVIIQSFKVKLVGRTGSGVPANYFYASLLTEDGNRYLAGFEGCAPVLSGAPLSPGQSAVGFLNFPLPPSKVTKTLEYSPRLMDDHEASTTRLPVSSASRDSPDDAQ